MNAPWFGFSFFDKPHSRLITNWIASARRRLSSVGVVKASSWALVCKLLQLSYTAIKACSVVRISLKSISCACKDRPDVCMWYLSFWLRSLAPYFFFIATAQMRLATRPMTVYSGSMPLEKKNDKLGAKSSIFMPRAKYASTKVKPFDKVNANWLIGLAPASAIW